MQDGYHRAFFIVCWIEFIIASMFILARCYTAWRLVRPIGADLYFSIATYILGAGSMTMLSLAAAHGLGVPIAILSRYERNSALLFGWINQYIALIAIGLAKFAIVIFLSRVHGHQTRKRTIMLWFLAVSNMIVNIIAMILALVQCSPVTRLWNDDQPGECPGRERVQIFGYVQGPYSAFVDFALALYPVLIFAKVQAFSISTRVGLCVLMGFGVMSLRDSQDGETDVVDEPGRCDPHTGRRHPLERDRNVGSLHRQLHPPNKSLLHPRHSKRHRGCQLDLPADSIWEAYDYRNSDGVEVLLRTTLYAHVYRQGETARCNPREAWCHLAQAKCRLAYRMRKQRWSCGVGIDTSPFG